MDTGFKGGNKESCLRIDKIENFMWMKGNYKGWI